jgi:hypothetical protein
MQADYAKKILKDLRQLHGLPTPPPGPPKRKPAMPTVGDATYPIKSRLADHLNHLLNGKLKDAHQMEIAATLNIPRKLQSRAKQRPYDYEWTLDNIARLAAALDIPLPTFLKSIAERNADDSLRQR